MATFLAIQSRIPEKVRGFILDKSSGHPLAGVVVEAFAQPIKDSEYTISLGLLVSDHAGYVSFDLKSFCGIQQLEHLWICPIGDAPAKVDLVIPTLSAIPAGIKADPPVLYRSQFAIKTDRDLVCNCNKSIPLPSIQFPDPMDWEISPYSFSTKSDLLLGEDGCQIPVPSTESEQEFRFAQVIRKAKKTNNHEAGNGRLVEYGKSDLTIGAKVLGNSYIAPLDFTNSFIEKNNTMEIAYGEVLEFKQTWKPKGHALGAILYSTALAPCESVNIAMIDWARQDEATRTDSIVSKESLFHSQRRGRKIEETINAALQEEQGGFSLMAGHGGAVATTIPIEGMDFHMGGTQAFGGAFAKSWGNRDLTGKSVQDLHDRVIQATNLVRSLDSTVVVQATQEEQNYLQTRTITNHNHCHALTIQYYEVLRHFKVETKYMRSREVVLLPFQIIMFTPTLALRFRFILETVLLDRELASCFDAMVRLNVSPEIYDIEKHKQPTPASSSKSQEQPKPKINRFELILESNPNYNWGTTWGTIIIDLRLKNGSFVKIWEKAPVGLGGVELNKLTFPTDLPSSWNIDPSDVDMVRVTWGEENSTDTWGFTGIRIRYALEGQEGLVGTIIDEHGTPELKRFDNSSNEIWTKDVSVEVESPDPQPTEEESEEQVLAIIFSRQEDSCCEKQLIAHLNANSAYYSRAIWLLQDPTERVMMVSRALAGFTDILSQIDFTPIAVSGNYVAFPLNELEDDQKEESRRNISPSVSIISLPTRGVFAETHMSHCNACEKRDVTRFWKWDESPCDKPPAIEGITPGPRGLTPQIQPTALPAPVVQIMQPPAAPDPVGLAAALNLLGQPNIFRDMSGLKELEDLLEGLASGAVDLVKGQQQLKALKMQLEAANSGKGQSHSGGGSGGSFQQQTPEERYDNLQVAKEISNSADELGLDNQQKADLEQGVLGGGGGNFWSNIPEWVTQGIMGATGSTTMRIYWPNPDIKRLVKIGTLDQKTGKIDQYDFDFIPTGRGSTGEIDGPLSHNGAYKILKNEPGNFVINVNIGNDNLQKNDVNINLEILDGIATLNGTFNEGKQGKETKADGKPVSVTGIGIKSDPFKIKFIQGSLEWY